MNSAGKRNRYNCMANTISTWNIRVMISLAVLALYKMEEQVMTSLFRPSHCLKCVTLALQFHRLFEAL